MRPTVLLGRAFALACVVTMAACSAGGSPSSPSGLTPGPASGSTLRVQYLDAEEPPVPGPTADPAPGPTPDPAPAPVTVQIEILGYLGSASFVPNPTPASMGNLIVWTNHDTAPHAIVLDDGTVIGDVAPGASTIPMALSSAAVTYHCAIHPSELGSISDGAAAPIPSPGGPPVPEPPDYMPYPPGDYY